MPALKNLVIGGGGITGFGILGILKNLDDNKLLNDIRNYLGTSIGSIICTLLIIGFTIEEIYDFAYELDFNKILDNGDIDCLLENYGLKDINILRYILKRLIITKEPNYEITFIELYNKYKKNLIVNGVCIDSNSMIFFNKKKSPNMKVIDAICISSCIPIVFTPFKFDNKMWVDGGIINNFPIDYFHKSMDNTLGITTCDECVDCSFNNKSEET